MLRLQIIKIFLYSVGYALYKCIEKTKYYAFTLLQNNEIIFFFSYL